MFNVLGEINWLAVLLATVLLAVLGYIYFGLLFTKQYARVLGNDPNNIGKMSTLAIVGPLVANLITIITSAILIQALGINTIGEGLLFGLIVGIGYLTAMTVNIAINPNFPRPFAYSILNAPYFVVGSLITSLVLVLF